MLLERVPNVQVAAGLPGNSALEVVGGKLKLAKHGKAEEPKLMPPFRQLVNRMLPKVDFPEPPSCLPLFPPRSAARSSDCSARSPDGE
ncbi:hypothetical protein [Streptomyces sp. NPDC056227]|uniref:hypothetical protein n=1 Tax=Streptomyces sp. NPDC056227 TaxID=3345753 RepID=UPI0035E29725